MADVTADMDAEHAASLGRRYLIKFEEDTLRPRPLWIRLIIEFAGHLRAGDGGGRVRGDQSLRRRRAD